MKKNALIVSVSLNIIIVCIFAGKRIYYHQPQKSNNFMDQWNAMRTSLFAMHAVDSNDIVFVGDSHTEAFPVTELFGTNCKNRGIGGNKTCDVLHRIAAIAERHPKKILIEAGVNDFLNDISIDSAFTNYTRIITTINKISPRSLICVQSTIPMYGYYATKNPSITELNRRLADYCKVNKVDFIDLHSRLISGNQLDSTLTADGIHLNGKGYEIWQQAVEGYVR